MYTVGRPHSRDVLCCFLSEVPVSNEPSPFKTSPDIWLLDGSGDLVNLLFFPMT